MEQAMVDKRQRIQALKSQVNKLQKENDVGLQQWYNKLERLRTEIKKVNATSMHTDQNIVGTQKINELKGKLFEISAKENKLLSELNSLQNIKQDQDTSLKSGMHATMVPEKLKELKANMTDLKIQKRNLEDQIKAT